MEVLGTMPLYRKDPLVLFVKLLPNRKKLHVLQILPVLFLTFKLLFFSLLHEFQKPVFASFFVQVGRRRDGETGRCRRQRQNDDNETGTLRGLHGVRCRRAGLRRGWHGGVCDEVKVHVAYGTNARQGTRRARYGADGTDAVRGYGAAGTNAPRRITETQRGRHGGVIGTPRGRHECRTDTWHGGSGTAQTAKRVK